MISVNKGAFTVLMSSWSFIIGPGSWQLDNYLFIQSSLMVLCRAVNIHNVVHPFFFSGGREDDDSATTQVCLGGGTGGGTKGGYGLGGGTEWWHRIRWWHKGTQVGGGHMVSYKMCHRNSGAPP